MKRNFYVLLMTAALLAGKSTAQVNQPCGTHGMSKSYAERNPAVLVYEKKLEEQTANFIRSSASALGRTTSHADTDWYDIPVVVHVMHDYGAQLLPDNKIYDLIAEMNKFYSLQYDYSGAIPAFQKYIGRAKIRFHLATKDPYGNPTKGITHHFTFLTYGCDDQAKLDQWAPTSYLNIWFIDHIGATTPGATIVAYATPPASAAAWPYADGVISNYSFIDDAYRYGGSKGGSIDHEVGHIFNLIHTFGGTDQPHTNKTGSCGDDDNVDDTPPTEGNLGGCAPYDTVCSTNYWKIYTSVHGTDSLVDYPDTSNEQNIMNYADCKMMFTKGQVERMRAALNSDVAGRDSLWSPFNLFKTGALDPLPDLAPVTDFAVRNQTSTEFANFTCPGVNLKFTNYSWGDTITSVSWTFDHSSSVSAGTTFSTPTSISAPLSVKFGDPGWVKLTLSATGNHGGTIPGGTTTTEYPRAAFVADPVGIKANDYFMEFNNSDTAKWPMFNYYGNAFKWQFNNSVGMYDHNCVQYVGYDYRPLDYANGIFPFTEKPRGDKDDLYSIPVDLTSFTSGQCNLLFNYSGASRSSSSVDINDSLIIDYSIDKSVTWKRLAILNRKTLDNKGAMSTPYTPYGPTDWAEAGFNIPQADRKDYVVFRFRYLPNVIVGRDGTVNTGLMSSGNNFYMDRVHFSSMPAGASNTKLDNVDVAIAPNPTTGDAYVIVKDAANSTAQIIVTDITGKTVYTVSEQLSGNEAHILIPHSAISTKGIYMVQTLTGNQARTQKLVVY